MHKAKLFYKVVEVLVAGVHMRFGAWKAYYNYFKSKQKLKLAYWHDPVEMVNIYMDKYPVEPEDITQYKIYSRNQKKYHAID